MCTVTSNGGLGSHSSIILAPAIRAEIWCVPAALLRLVDHAVIVEKSRTVWSDASQGLRDAPAVREAHLHV